MSFFHKRKRGMEVKEKKMEGRKKGRRDTGRDGEGKGGGRQRRREKTEGEKNKEGKERRREGKGKRNLPRCLVLPEARTEGKAACCGKPDAHMCSAWLRAGSSSLWGCIPGTMGRH